MLRAVLIWAGLTVLCIVPIAAAAFSPLLAWRDPIYIFASFFGIVGMALMVFQPLLAAGSLPGLPLAFGRRVHRVIGVSIVAAIVLHVGALWITSPPDVLDALLLVSPTPFSVWGVMAMWAVFAAATLAVFRKRLPLRVWRMGHTSLVAVTILGTVVHVLLIQGTMETVSKIMLCVLLVAAIAKTVTGLRAWGRRPRHIAEPEQKKTPS